MTDFDIIRQIEKITDLNDMSDFIILGFIIGMVGFVVFQMSQGAVPGIIGMLMPGLAGAILGAMLYIFAIGTS